MTDITDQDRSEVLRVLDQMQGYVGNAPGYTGNPREWLRDLRAVFPAPVLTLAEELRAPIGHNQEGIKCIAFSVEEVNRLAGRAEQIEQERDNIAESLDRRGRELAAVTLHRDKALAEVQRLTAERQEETMRRMDEQYAGLPVRDRDWLDKNGFPDPADVIAGEPWLVEVEGKTVAAFRLHSTSARQWIVPIHIRGAGLPFHWVSDDAVRLVARLVPEARS
jgi:hypothetical protein